MESGSLIGQKYILKQKIGDGATCEVWEAAHKQTSRPVAIKLILRSTEVFRHRLLREARICGEISHRNVIEVLDAGQLDNGDPYLVMPLLQGETLAALIERQFRLEVPMAAQIGRDVARALAAAHAKSIIHRDLKPANIFLHNEPGADGAVVKVLDFGIGKNLAAEESVATVVGGLMGSPAYMSPEQVRCDPNLDHRTDIWSLGVVLFEMLTGKRPFDGATAQEVIGKIARGEVPKLSQKVRNVDASLEALVWHCMQVDREKRAKSAAEVAKILDGFTSAGESSRVMMELPSRDRISTSADVNRKPASEISPSLAAEPAMPARRVSAPFPQAPQAPQASPVVASPPLGLGMKETPMATHASAEADDDANATLKFSPSHFAKSAAAPNALLAGGTMPLDANTMAIAQARSQALQAQQSAGGRDAARDSSVPGFMAQGTTEKLDPSHFAGAMRPGAQASKDALNTRAEEAPGPRGTMRLPNDPRSASPILNAGPRGTMKLEGSQDEASAGMGSGSWQAPAASVSSSGMGSGSWPSSAAAMGNGDVGVTTSVPASMSSAVISAGMGSLDSSSRVSGVPGSGEQRYPGGADGGEEGKKKGLRMAVVAGAIAAVVVVGLVLGVSSLLGGGAKEGVEGAEKAAQQPVVTGAPTVSAVGQKVEAVPSAVETGAASAAPSGSVAAVVQLGAVGTQAAAPKPTASVVPSATNTSRIFDIDDPKPSPTAAATPTYKPPAPQGTKKKCTKLIKTNCVANPGGI